MLDVPRTNNPHVPRSPHHHHDLRVSSLSDIHPTESDSDDDSDDFFQYDFPQPPSISPALRRMRSSPWYSQQLEAIAKPERRHSVSPLIQHPNGGPQSILRPESQTFSHKGLDSGMGLVSTGPGSRSVSKGSEDVAESHERLKPPFYKDTVASRRLDRLPPPAPAPSIPLPRLPRIIRKVASMRSESKHDPVEPMTSSRRPVPKIRSLKFMSGSMLGSSTSQPPKQEERKRSWSLSKPTSLQKTKADPAADAPYVTLSSTNGHLSNCASNSRVPLRHASPVVYSNPCLATIERNTSSITFNPEGRFDLSRGNTSLAPPFAHRTTRSSANASRRYSNTSCGESTLPGLGTSPGKTGSTVSHERRGLGLHSSSHPLYSVGNGDKGRNASSGALFQGAKSFINITPEKRKGMRGKSKSRVGSIDHGSEAGKVGLGITMKEKREKMKKLFSRASSGVVDWGRHLTGRAAKSATASSTSGSLTPLTGARS